MEVFMVRYGPLVVLCLCALLLVAGTAGGGRQEDTTVIEVDGHVDVVIHNPDGGDIEVRVFLAVTDGPEIDVFLMAADMYADYANESDFDYYKDYSFIGVKNLDETYVWDEEGTYHLVLDNTAYATPPPVDPEFQNATVTYVVTWSPAEEGIGLRDATIYLLVAVMVVFAVVLVVRWVRAGRQRGEG